MGGTALGCRQPLPEAGAPPMVDAGTSTGSVDAAAHD
jgi:hypothetical protein